MANRRMLYYNYKKKEKMWTNASVAAAVEAYNNKQFKNMDECAKYYHLSKTKLFTALQVDKGTKTITHQGRKPVLTAEDEHEIAGVIATMARSGFPITSREIPEVVRQYCDIHAIDTPWEMNTPGHRWIQQFRCREKLVIRKAQTISLARHRAVRNPFIIKGFYHVLDAEFDKLDILDRPDLIFNCDETGFPHDPSKVPVVVRQGEECLDVTLGAGRENTTVVACCAADGTLFPPYIIFKGANRPDEARIFFDKETGQRHEDMIAETTYDVSDNGWITTDLFYKWFTDIFLPRAKKGDEPILLIFDGHLSHVSVPLIEKARQMNVTLLKLPPHTSSVLQPLDVSCFGPIKTRWQQILIPLKRRKQVLSKDQFCNQVGAVWNVGLTVTNIKSGFRSTGICPFDPERYTVPFDPVLLEKYEKWLDDGKPERNDGEEYNIADVTPTTPAAVPSVAAGPVTPVLGTDSVTPVSSAASTVDEEMYMVPPKPTHDPIPGYPQPSSNHVAQWTLAWVPVWTEANESDCAPKRTPQQKEAAFHKALITSMFHSGPAKKQRKINLSAEVITKDEFYHEKLKKVKKRPTTSTAVIEESSDSSAEEEDVDVDVTSVKRDPVVLAAIQMRDLSEKLAEVWVSLEDSSALDKFYAVYYAQKPYIGKILRVIHESGDVKEVEMKFLFSRDIPGRPVPMFCWPRQDDVEVVEKMHIFAGPLSVKPQTRIAGPTGRKPGGQLPPEMEVEGYDEIRTRYMIYKRHLNELLSSS